MPSVLSAGGELACSCRRFAICPRIVDDARLLAATRGRTSSLPVFVELDFVHQLIRFILLCEGSSDRALVPHLQQLLLVCGASEAVGAAISLATVRDPGGGRGSVLERKMRAILSTESELDLLFVHRDADGAGYEVRSQEIIEASCNAELNVAQVSIIPVRTTEAWVLLDEAAIRRVAGNPGGRQPLELPRPSKVEDLAAPKEVLETALAAASGYRGQRLRKFRRKFGQYRRILLEQLPAGGDLGQVSAWRRLKDDISGIVSRQDAD